ncbi:MAG: class I SAM-dependent methyltransferase [Thermaceae bacterium]|nr:class I SAM-dependent methyltransferase [Thermaceae bacterium]
MANYESAELYDKIYGFKNYAQEAELIHQTIQQFKPGAKTLLDVACGTGKHLEPLKTCYQVEGLDLSADLLREARKRNPELSFHQGDMRNFELRKRFDAVTCLFSAVGYMNGPEELQQAMNTMAKHLEPGGVLLLEPWIFPQDWESGHLGINVVDELGLKLVRINRSRLEGRHSVLMFHYIQATHQEIQHWDEEHPLFLFTRGEYEGALERAGLSVQFDEPGIAGRGLFTGIKGR